MVTLAAVLRRTLPADHRALVSPAEEPECAGRDLHNASEWFRDRLAVSRHMDPASLEAQVAA